MIFLQLRVIPSRVSERSYSFAIGMNESIFVVSMQALFLTLRIDQIANLQLDEMLCVQQWCGFGSLSCGLMKTPILTLTNSYVFFVLCQS